MKDENINWTEQHQTWLQNFENNEENDEEMQQDSEDDSSDESDDDESDGDDEENEDEVPEQVTKIYNYLQEELFQEFIRTTVESNQITQIPDYFRYLQFRFGDKLKHIDNIIIAIEREEYGGMDEECIDLLKICLAHLFVRGIEMMKI